MPEDFVEGKGTKGIRGDGSKINYENFHFTAASCHHVDLVSVMRVFVKLNLITAE